MRRPAVSPLSMRLAVLLLLAAAPALAAPFTAFRDGESFTYKISFAFFSKAGELDITARHDTHDGAEVVRVSTETSSRGVVRSLYKLDNKAEVVIERRTGRMLWTKESGEDSKRASDTETKFDYAKRIARHEDRVRTERTTDIPIPDGDPLDLISALVQTRDWNLKPGEKRDALVHFGRDLYPLSIHAERYEEVRTPLGKYKALVLVPRMDEKDAKGLFKRGGEIKVWIAQDGSRLPVKMQLKLKYGTASLVLSEHKEPGK